jgi:hypothetical protein
MEAVNTRKSSPHRATQHLQITDSPGTNSSYSYCIALYRGVIHYKAVEGTTVTTSSTEAELLTLSMTAKEFIQWKRFFQQIQFDPEEEPTIYCDNLQTIRLMTKETSKLQTALN